MRTLCTEEGLRASGIFAHCPAPTLLHVVHCTPKVSNLDPTLSSTLTITPNLGVMKAGNGDRYRNNPNIQSFFVYAALVTK